MQVVWFDELRDALHAFLLGTLRSSIENPAEEKNLLAKELTFLDINFQSCMTVLHGLPLSG